MRHHSFLLVVLCLAWYPSCPSSVYASLWWSARDKIVQGQSGFISYFTAARMMQDGVGSALYNLNRQSLYQDRILKFLQSPFRFQDGWLAYDHPPFEIGC